MERQDKTVFSSLYRISRLYKTVSKLSVPDCLDLAPIMFTPPTQITVSHMLLFRAVAVETTVQPTCVSRSQSALSEICADRWQVFLIDSSIVQSIKRREWRPCYKVMSSDELWGDVPVGPLIVNDQVIRTWSSSWMSVELTGRVWWSVVDWVTDVV